MIKKVVGVFVLSIICLLGSYAQNADGVLGEWKTIDDETGEAKSIVKLYKEGDKLFGKVVKILTDKQDAKCEECDDDDPRKGQKVLGMVIIENMEWDEDEWEDGTILDPNNGSVYDCKIWLDEDDPNKLNVRGYIAFLFRTQYWYRQ